MMIDILTPNERAVLSLLKERTIASRADVMDALRANGSKAEPSIVKVLVSYLRSKLGLEIHSVYGLGYQLTPKDRETLRLPQLDTPGTAYLKARAAVKGGADVVR